MFKLWVPKWKFQTSPPVLPTLSLFAEIESSGPKWSSEEGSGGGYGLSFPADQLQGFGQITDAPSPRLYLERFNIL